MHFLQSKLTDWFFTEEVLRCAAVDVVPVSLVVHLNTIFVCHVVWFSGRPVKVVCRRRTIRPHIRAFRLKTAAIWTRLNHFTCRQEQHSVFKNVFERNEFDQGLLTANRSDIFLRIRNENIMTKTFRLVLFS